MGVTEDLEFVEANMEEDDDKKKHKHRMRSMHQDFWAVLRWQRRCVATHSLPLVFHLSCQC